MNETFLDTNIVVDWLRHRPEAYEELSRYDQPPRISRIAWTEVLAGEPPASRATIMHLLRRFDVVELDQRIGSAAADIRHRTRMKLLDAFILATARVNGGLLITRNTRDFPASMPGIRVPYTL